MDKKTSTTVNQAYTASRSAGVRRRSNVKMVQNVRVIWLDPHIDEENSADSYHTAMQPGRVIHTIDTFTDGEECIEFVEATKNEKACMIISGSLGKHIVPRIHNMSQVDSIFIFCGNKKHHEHWTKEWPKIKGLFTEIKPICEALKKAAQECEHNAIPISFVAIDGDISNKNLDQLDNSFMYTQIMKEILLTITFEEKHIKQFIEHCREQLGENEDDLQTINQLEQQYHHKTPIWWYTYECFLYPMLNRALRLMDVDVIIKMVFFIIDLHCHIKRLHVEQFNGHQSDGTFTLYRGQGLSKEAFEQMQQIKGGLISFNSFLSTSKNRDISLLFARRAVENPDLVGVIFVMIIDPSKSITPFTYITDVSYFQGEGEVLFSMHTVFRIQNIKPTNENLRLFQVDLTLTSDNDNDLCLLTDRIREETFPNSKGWYRLGSLLHKMGQSEKSHQVYQSILEQTTNENYKAPVYNQLGVAKYNQGEYEEAIAFYKKSLKIKRKTLPPNHLDLAMSYNNIGGAYRSLGKYSMALLYYEKDLKISQKTLAQNHPDLVISYNNIGNAYYNTHDYSKALSSYGKALAIQQESLPPNHHSLGASYNNIGNVYDDMGDYPKALSSYEKALEIKEKAFPPNHPSLGASYNNIGTMYEKIGDYLKARSFLERAVDNGERSLPPNHPTLKQRQKNLEDVKKKL